MVEEVEKKKCQGTAWVQCVEPKKKKKKKKRKNFLFSGSFLHLLHLHSLVAGATRNSGESAHYIVTSKILPTSSEVFTERSSKRGIISNNSLS